MSDESADEIIEEGATASSHVREIRAARGREEGLLDCQRGDVKSPINKYLQEMAKPVKLEYLRYLSKEEESGQRKQQEVNEGDVEALRQALNQAENPAELAATMMAYNRPNIIVSAHSEMPLLPPPKIPEFNDESHYLWEEHEDVLSQYTRDRTEVAKCALLRSSLGPAVLSWYNTQRLLFNLPYAEQIESLRKKFQLGEALRQHETLIMREGRETVLQFSTRVQRHFLAQSPKYISEWTELTNPLERERVATRYERDFEHIGQMMANAFIRGLPPKWYNRILEKRDQPKTLTKAVEIVTRWEKVQEVSKRHNEQNTFALINEERSSGNVVTYAAQAQSGQTMKEMRERIKEELMKEQEAKKQGDNMKQIAEALETLPQRMQTCMQVTFAPLRDDLTTKLNQLMTVDTKPTAKAGTKADPTMDQLQQNQAARVCYGCKKPGHFRNECPDAPQAYQGGGRGGRNQGRRGGYTNTGPRLSDLQKQVQAIQDLLTKTLGPEQDSKN